MRSFSKKLAFVLAAAMVLTGFAPAAQAKAADDFSLNRTSYILYTSTESVNHHGSDTLADGLYGNVEKFDFNLKNAPADWATAYTYKWASSKEAVATVATGGLVTAKSVGVTEISCTITEKATGKVAATLKATVTVKANAAEVEIEAADGVDYDGAEVAPGTKIDFNRTMADQDGNWSNIKGKYVTDEIRWVVSPADKGVTVDQSNGVVTVGADADGEYTVYAEAYQSKMYNQTTASSNKVVFNVNAAKELEIEQTAVTKFTIDLGTAVDSIGEVTVTRLYPTATAVYEYPMGVKAATLNDKDKSKVNVELFNNLADNTNYVVTVAGFEPKTFTAQAGNPDSIVLSASATEVSPFVQYGPNPVALYYRLYDGTVDVTDLALSKGTVLLSTETFSQDGKYFVSNNQIWFAEENIDVTVVAEYQSNEYKDGVPAVYVKDSAQFTSVSAPTTVIDKVEAYTLTGWQSAKTYVPFGEPATLGAKIKLSAGDPVTVENGGNLLDGTVLFEAVTTDVAVMEGTSVVFFKQGVAKFIVNYVTVVNGQQNILPIGTAVVEAREAKAFKDFKLSATALTMGTAENYNTETITVTAEDNYGGAATLTSVVVTGADANATAALVGVNTTELGKIKLNASTMINALNGAPATAQLTFKVKVNDKLEKTFTVLIKKPGVAGTEYINIVADGFGKDVARTAASDATKAEKTASFTVFKMSNGVKVGVQDILPYDANNVTTGAYYFKVMKDGVDVTNKVDISNIANGVVTLKFSKATTALANVVDNTGAAVDGFKVEYDLEGGNYVFTLYQGMAAGDKAVAIQRNSSVGSVTCNKGAYGNAVRKVDTVPATDAKTIRDAFAVKNAAGQDATAPFSVDATVAGAYVNVKSITFYDEVASGVYAPYTVNVGVTLKVQ